MHITRGYTRAQGPLSGSREEFGSRFGSRLGGREEGIGINREFVGKIAIQS